jgi:hypothetical protein
MKEIKGHIYHQQRKWKCPKCAKVRMQKQRGEVPLVINADGPLYRAATEIGPNCAADARLPTE